MRSRWNRLVTGHGGVGGIIGVTVLLYAFFF